LFAHQVQNVHAVFKGQVYFGLYVTAQVNTFRFSMLYVASAGVSAGVELLVSSLRLRFYVLKQPRI